MDLRFPGLHSCVSPHGDAIGSLNIMYSRWNLFFRFYSILKKKKKKRQSPVKEAGEEWARFSCEWGSTTLSRNEVERGQAGAGMHGEVKCEDFVSFIWMGSGVVTGARSDRGAVSRAQRLCRASGFQVRILGTYWGLSRWPQRGPQDPHLTAGGRVEWQHLGGTGEGFGRSPKD